MSKWPSPLSSAAPDCLRDLLELHPGAVVQLHGPATSPVDIFVNGTLIAKGEVVVVDDDFGVRITDLVDRA